VIYEAMSWANIGFDTTKTPSRLAMLAPVCAQPLKIQAQDQSPRRTLTSNFDQRDMKMAASPAAKFREF